MTKGSNPPPKTTASPEKPKGAPEGKPPKPPPSRTPGTTTTKRLDAVPPKDGKTLIQKLCEVQETVGLLPKTGWNAHHKYHYVTEGAVLDCVRHELASRHVWLQPQVDAWHILDPVGKMTPAIVEMTFTWRDGDSTEEWAVPWVGAGSDTTDKHIFKAETGALKFFLLKTFLIPTGDDPEAGDDKRFEGKTPEQETVESAGAEAVAKAGGNFVLDVRKKMVGAKKDKTKYDITLTSGKADTWSKTLALKALGFSRNKTRVDAKVNSTKWGDELESIEEAKGPAPKPEPSQAEAKAEVEAMRKDGRLKKGTEVRTQDGDQLDLETGEVDEHSGVAEEIARGAFGSEQPPLEEGPLTEDDIPF